MKCLIPQFCYRAYSTHSDSTHRLNSTQWQMEQEFEEEEKEEEEWRNRRRTRVTRMRRMTRRVRRARRRFLIYIYVQHL